MSSEVLPLINTNNFNTSNKPISNNSSYPKGDFYFSEESNNHFDRIIKSINSISMNEFNLF